LATDPASLAEAPCGRLRPLSPVVRSEPEPTEAPEEL